jgi:transposase
VERVLPIADTETSPEDLAILRAFLVKLLANAETDKVVDTVLVLVARLLREQARLSGRIKALMRGHAEGGSEKFGPAQLQLWKDALEELAAEPPAADNDDVVLPPLGNGDEEGPANVPKRKGLPTNLERRHVVVPVEPALRVCALCGADKTCIGHETSEVLELVPARFEVIVYDREKLACVDCPAGGVVVAPAVVKPLDGGIPGPGLLADVVIRKGDDSTPINRILRIYRRLGVDLAENTVYGWWSQAAEILRPIAGGIRLRALAAHLTQVDDTGIRVLDKDTPDGSRHGHMWGMLGDGIWASFHYTKTWKGDEMAVFLADRVGWLQADGYAGYERLYRKAEPAIEVGCWSHARRYFVKAEDEGDRRARAALVHIGEIFTIDAYATKKNFTPEQRLELRRQRAPASLKHLWATWTRLRSTITPRSPLGEAYTYLTNQRMALERFLEDGRLPLENGAAERLARHVAVGRKNWLHCASDLGAERLAVIFTVLHTARMQGADLAAGLAFAFDALARRPYTAEEARELLPDHWPREKLHRG